MYLDHLDPASGKKPPQPDPVDAVLATVLQNLDARDARHFAAVKCLVRAGKLIYTT